MSQAAFNIREQRATRSGRSNGAQLAGFFFFLLVLGTLIGSGYTVIKWMGDPERLPLSRLVVTGERHYTTDDDIRQAIMSLGSPGTFMTQDVNVLQRQIERLPWIQRVSVRKQWPDELKIHIVEYSPVARWNDLQLIDAEGRAFTLPEERSAQLLLPMLYGPEESGKEVLQEYGRIRQLLLKEGIELKSVLMSARRSWQVVLNNDVKIELGRHHLMERLKRFISLYPSIAQQAEGNNQRIDYVDLRYDTGIAVGWASGFIESQGISENFTVQ